MTICSLCKKKFSFWNSCIQDDKEYCPDCWKKHQDKIMSIKLKIEKEEKAINLEKHGKTNLNWTKWIFHLIASINFIYAIFLPQFYPQAEYVTQETVMILLQLKFILIAIFFEVIALRYEYR